jgi:hypothetical protein
MIFLQLKSLQIVLVQQFLIENVRNQKPRIFMIYEVRVLEKVFKCGTKPN